MKAKLQRLFKRIFAFLLVMLISIDVPITVSANSNLLDVDTAASSSLAELENAALSGEGSYSYTAPDEGRFWVVSVSGTINITNGTPVIQFAEYTVAFPTFDYYKIVDPSGNVRFYQADVAKNPTQTSNFSYIAIYIEEGPRYSIHVHYSIEAENKLYNIVASLTDDQFLYFTQLSTELCLGTDIVSQRLKSSARVYTHGTFENCDNSELDYVNSESNNTVMPTALNPISENAYDEYTNSDGTIHSYVSDGFGDYRLDEDDWIITDDPIVDIIPKELCFILGEHIYVGKEYGFFIRVVVDSYKPADYAVDILIFDFSYTNPSFPTDNTGIVRVEPLFQFTYRASTGGWFDMDPALSCVVFPHTQYDYAEYYLKDVGFKVTLDNPTILNPGDNGYDPYADDGAFIIQTRINASGVGLKKKDGNFSEDTALFTLGFVPYVGTGLSILSYVHDVYNGFGNGNYFYTAEETTINNEANIETEETNSTDQINAHGNLVKSKSVALLSNEEKPRLIHVGGGYVETRYVVARKSGSTYNKIRVTTSISVSVVEDNTSVFLGIQSGEVVNYGRGTGTYETSAYKRLDNITVNGSAYLTVPANSQTNVIKLTPRVSGSYKIYTSGYNGDPNFRITNASKGTSAVSATDDINGANDRNAVLTINLIGGDIYYLEAFRYGAPYSYTLRIGYNPTSTRVLSANTPYSVTTTSDSFQMLKFTPSISGNYKISTNKTSGDPQLFLFNATGLLLGSDDDSGGNRNALLECYLVGGTTYYIAVQGYNGNPAVFSVTAASLS